MKRKKEGKQQQNKSTGTNDIWGRSGSTARRPLGASLSLLVLQSNFQPLRYGYQHDDVEVDKAAQGHRRPCLLSSSYCRLTLGHPLFRPPSTARRRRIETRLEEGRCA